MGQEQKTRAALQRLLNDAETQERQWQTALADYPGTEYARLAEATPKKLRTLKESIHQEMPSAAS